jgi:putative sterol carrier protein
MAKLLDKAGETATTQFTVLMPDGLARWRIDLQESGASCREEAADAADLEIVVGEGTWWEIASGRLSPVDAFSRGELRILGDTALATRLYKALAAPEGMTDVCF